MSITSATIRSRSRPGRILRERLTPAVETGNNGGIMSSPVVGQSGTFTLERTGDSQLIVTGTVLVSESETYDRGPAPREFRILLIRADSGKYVAGIRYATQVGSDQAVSIATVCSTLADVRKSIVAFGESLESLPIGYPPMPQFKSRQESLIRDLRNTFNAAAGRVLNRPEFAERI